MAQRCSYRLNHRCWPNCPRSPASLSRLGTPALCAPCAGIYDTLKECACISKSAGGIGLSMHNIRATGSYIRGTNGSSNGIVPMLRVFNDTGAPCMPRCRPVKQWTHCWRPATRTLQHSDRLTLTVGACAAPLLYCSALC